MRASQTPSEVAARVLERLPAVLDAERPAAVLVQGDTTTTVAAALAAFYARRARRPRRGGAPDRSAGLAASRRKRIAG